MYDNAGAKGAKDFATRSNKGDLIIQVASLSAMAAILSQSRGGARPLGLPAQAEATMLLWRLIRILPETRV